MEVIGDLVALQVIALRGAIDTTGACMIDSSTRARPRTQSIANLPGVAPATPRGDSGPKYRSNIVGYHRTLAGA